MVAADTPGCGLAGLVTGCKNRLSTPIGLARLAAHVAAVLPPALRAPGAAAG
jgi:hypothetical protein